MTASILLKSWALPPVSWADHIHLLSLAENFLCTFTFFSLPRECRFRLQALGNIAGELSKPLQAAAFVTDCRDQNACPKL